MAEQQVPVVSQLGTKPGIQRDGTDLDANLWNDGQWVRFVRAAGRPKKMGGYRAISQYMTGPIRAVYVWSRQLLNAIYSFSSTKVEVLSADQNGIGSSIQDRTPVTRTATLTPVTGTIVAGELITGGTSLKTGVIATLSGTTATLVYVTGAFTNGETVTGTNGGTAVLTAYTVTAFTGGENYNWQVDSMFDAAAQSNKSIVIAHGAPNLASIDDGITTPIFVGDITDFTLPLESTGQYVSGGVVVATPYLISYGSDGQVTWCNANEPLNITTGDANTLRVSAAKVVKGLPLRSGQGTSALLWTLSDVIRLAWVGGTAIFRVDTLSSQSSILSSSSVIEYDGVYFWVGIDRFLTYNGTVREVPNTVNLQWFFDNLNFDQRQKVTVMKVPKYGEIWWLFPFGDATEADTAIIYNVRLDTWYDSRITRSCGDYSQMFKFPVFADSDVGISTIFVGTTGITGTFQTGETVTESVTGATGVVVRVSSTGVYLVNTSGTFTGGHTLTGGTTGATATSAAPVDTDLYTVWAHEVGLDKVEGDNQVAIQAYIESSDFGYPTGSVQESQQGPDRWTRLTRIEPDFVQAGNMTVTVISREFANADVRESDPYTFDNTTTKIDMRQQGREIHVRYESNVAGGNFEMGKPLYHIEMGDVRN